MLNPMTSVTMGFRWALYGVGPAPDIMLALVFYLTALMSPWADSISSARSNGLSQTSFEWLAVSGE